MQFVICCLFMRADSTNMILVIRFLYGFSFGFTCAVTTSAFIEILPEWNRGKGILLVNFCISLGKIYAVVIGFIFIEEDLRETNWKVMMLFSGLPNLLVLYGCYSHLK